MSIRESSILANQAMADTKKDHRKQIKTSMFLIHKPATSQQITDYKYTRLTRPQVARRLSEMREEGIIQEVGRAENIKFKPILWDLIK